SHISSLVIVNYLQYSPVAAFFFFNHPSTSEIYTLSLHDALPICAHRAALSLPERGVSGGARALRQRARGRVVPGGAPESGRLVRSEEHTSELQSLAYLVCRLLLEKKKHK